jgi:hypothetical protein
MFLTCMTKRRSAFPVRMSYNVNVLSVPADASIEDSERLNLIEVTVSLEVENVMLDIGAVLYIAIMA